MKKLALVLALILALAVMLVSCKNDVEEAPENNEEVVENNNETPEETPDAPEASGAVLSAEELQAAIDKIYEKYPLPFMVGSFPDEMVYADADSYKFYTGLADSSKINATIVSESMIGSQAYSLVLVSVKEGEDVEAIATEMINGIDQRKWMCVEADLIRTVASGNTVMLIMIDSQMQIGIDGFVDAFVEAVGEVTFEATKN